MTRKDIGFVILLVAGSAQNASPTEALTNQSSVNADAVYEACFAPGGDSIAQDMKLTAYSLLVAKNGTKSSASRDYVSGPFAKALASDPSPIRTAFMSSARTATAQFTSNELSEIVRACRVDPRKLSSMRAELRSKMMKIVSDSFLLQMKRIMEITTPELDRRGLVSPFT